MKKANLLLAVLALNCQGTFWLNNNDFSTNEIKFKQFFSSPSNQQSDVQKSVDNQMHIANFQADQRSQRNQTWHHDISHLHYQHKIFIVADTLGHETTKVIRFLLRDHLRVVHHDSLKETLTSKLESLNINPKQVIFLFWTLPVITTREPWMIATIISILVFHPLKYFVL